MQWTTAKIRQSFLDFFKERGHEIVPSASIIPRGDATLLFTNAGMVPFKDYFLGIRTPTAKRVADSQKCLRISGKHNDLEAVGRDTYHHTFFEMLGNWSFGDYYKEAAIPWHWELITKVWKIPTERLWATIYTDDDEAEAVLEEDSRPAPGPHPALRERKFLGDGRYRAVRSVLRRSTTIAAMRRARGTSHNGQQCAVNVDGCERFVELGNLVFIQYNRDASGKLTPLPMKHVDTGSGLERIAAAIQSIETGKLLGNYDIDLFQTIIKRIERVTGELGNGARYGQNEEFDISFRAIADHARTMSFLAAEGLTPGNSDREYVMRRIIRRAARHGRYLGIHSAFLAQVQKGVIDAMGDAYPELRAEATKIAEVVTAEEVRFGETLDRGLELIDAERAKMKSGGSRILSGEVAFKLYDTYGFPLDLTQDVLRSDGIEVDVAGLRGVDGSATRARPRGTQGRHVHAGDSACCGHLVTLRRLSRIRTRCGNPRGERQGRRVDRYSRRGDSLLSRRRRAGRRSRRHRGRIRRAAGSRRHAQSRRLHRACRAIAARRNR